MVTERPSWQRDSCPPWCEGGHREDDHPHDRVHVIVGRAVPVPPDTSSGLESEPVEIAVWRREGETRTWLSLARGAEQHLRVPLPHAADVLAAAAHIVRVVDPRLLPRDHPPPAPR